jgi:hypothetical protein
LICGGFSQPPDLFQLLWEANTEGKTIHTTKSKEMVTLGEWDDV